MAEEKAEQAEPEERDERSAEAAEGPPPQEKHPLAQMVVIGVVASAIGVAAALAIDWFPLQGSTQAEDVDSLYDILLIASVPVFVLVMVVVGFCVWKFRMRPGEELKDGPPIHGNTMLEIVWTAVPAALLVGLCTYAWIVLNDMEEAQAGRMQINAVGEQFAWTFEYPASAMTGGKEIRSAQLYVPCRPVRPGSRECEGTPIQFTVRAKDVIHSFWVPEWRMKKDAVPGIDTRVRVTPTRLGRYPVVCAELCGLGHAAMRQSANVVTPEAFRAWARRQGAGAGGGSAQAPAQQGGGGGGGADSAAAGKQVFTTSAEPPCATCHTLSDAGSQASTGPNLDTALRGMSAEEIRRAIVDPGAELAEGFQNIMPPNYGDTLSQQEQDALVAYLEEVAAK